MNELHPTEVEIVAEAHARLQNGGTAMKSATDACAYELDEVISEADNIPGPVVRAHNAAQDGDRDLADELLTEFLTDTNYDPNDPDSYHPNA